MTGKPLPVDQESLRKLLVEIHTEAWYGAQHAIDEKDGAELSKVARKYQRHLERELEKYGLKIDETLGY